MPLPSPNTPAPRHVVLVGSLQSELGCPGDWGPGCTASGLRAVDGQRLTWSATFDVPAGAWDYKVALNGTWDENYGGGGAAHGPDLRLAADGRPVRFTYEHATHLVTADPLPLGAARSAHWLRAGLLAWRLPPERTGWTYRLHAAPSGGLALDDGAVTGGTSYPLTLSPDPLPASIRRQVPHLTAYDALTLSPADARRARTLLRGQVVLAAYDPTGALAITTGVQVPVVLDALYAAAAGRVLGVTWAAGSPTLALWAPTARRVALALGDQSVAMRRDADGVWSVRGDPSWRGMAYAYDVTVVLPTTGEVVVNRVTDPYSLALTTNSERSVVVDLADPALEPAGWDDLQKPRLPSDAAETIYELHLRDFSVGDETVRPEWRCTYEAFREADSAGMRHLRALAEAGMTTLHLLPLNDVSSIEERRAEQQEPACDLPSFPPDSEGQQACISAVAARDGFNWGYDPLHWTTPEGSYATDPEGPARTRELRDMVQAVNAAGLRVVMDVVYNHTPASGQDAASVLDRVVPGYYHRLSATGEVEDSTCCSNTATEHRMMAKLMVDSVLTWARDYKVDGFRFDLMGHQPKAAMLAVRAALDALTPARDGVEGREVYLYGEGWDFGEVAGDARFVQATQANMAGTGIGTFSDRLRDAVRGGGPFDEDPRVQGFATGLAGDPNGAPVNGTAADQLLRLLHSQDLIKLGLAGNLRDYRFVDRTGTVVSGAELDYNGSPAGYAAGPSETVTYVDAHDNETIFDAIQLKLPASATMTDRVRMSTLALSTTAFAQGPSFWHAGADLLRSKSMDRNSYDSGDWFNRVDWTGQESTWGSGLPPAAENEERWAYMRPLLADPALGPGPADIAAARERALELLRIRASSPLFRLGTAARIKDRVSFPLGGRDQTPGGVVMVIDDTAGEDLDPACEGLVVVWNATPDATTQSVPGLVGASYALHPVQAGGGDPVVQTSSYEPASGAFTVPARTVAVFRRS